MFILDLNFNEPIYTIYQGSIHQVRFTKANLLLHQAAANSITVDVAFELAGCDKTDDNLLSSYGGGINVTNDLQGAIEGTAQWVCIGNRWLTGVSHTKINVGKDIPKVIDTIEQCSKLRFVNYVGNGLMKRVEMWKWDGTKPILAPFCSDVHVHGHIHSSLVYDMLHGKVLRVKGKWYYTAEECSKANYIKVFTFNKQQL